MCLSDVTCAFLEINAQIRLKLYGIDKLIHGIDFYLSNTSEANLLYSFD